MTTHPTTLTPTDDAPTACADTRARPAAASAPQAGGMFWFAGWLFTIGFVELVWWKVLLAIIAWPYFLGVALH